MIKNGQKIFIMIANLDAFAVHYGGGITGVLMAPILSFNGVVYWTSCSNQVGYNEIDFVCDHTVFKQFAWNLMGAIVITLWSGTITSIIFYLLAKFESLR